MVLPPQPLGRCTPTRLQQSIEYSSGLRRPQRLVHDRISRGTGHHDPLRPSISNNKDSRLDWIAGLYYKKDEIEKIDRFSCFG